MDRRYGSGDSLRLEHLHLCVVSDCEDLFADGGISFRCLCDCRSALVGIFTMADRGRGAVIRAERGYPFVCRRAVANIAMVDISQPRDPQWNLSHSLVPRGIYGRHLTLSLSSYLLSRPV